MRYPRLLFICLFALAVSCSDGRYQRDFTFSKVEIVPLIEDLNLSVRALEVGKDYLFYGSKDHLGRVALNRNLKLSSSHSSPIEDLNHFKNIMTHNNEPLHFRAIAEVKGDFFGISIGNPARLYRLPKKGNKAELVYEEIHESVFYDSMAFWNNKEGLAIGDPTEECMSIIITRDSGKTWNKVPCEKLPVALDGEAAFAASDTNIAIVGENTWIATGGLHSRVLYSGDKGRTWDINDVPIIQGKSTTGLYSIDFYNKNIGFGIGGDYTQPNDSLSNKIKTIDGGQTWNAIADGQSPGYRSCVQFIPNSEGEELVAVGYKGIDYSKDSGQSWAHLSDEGFYTIRFINDTMAFAGGRGRICKLVFR
ncbi:MAG: oxidoreductase [Bacteroidota bacterium]